MTNCHQNGLIWHNLLQMRADSLAMKHILAKYKTKFETFSDQSNGDNAKFSELLEKVKVNFLKLLFFAFIVSCFFLSSVKYPFMDSKSKLLSSFKSGMNTNRNAVICSSYIPLGVPIHH